MGDRGNIFVRGRDDAGVYLYTHWSGSDLPTIVKRALARKERWDDGPYLTRILFDTLTSGQQGAPTGYGISSEIGDNQYPIVVVDPANEKVAFLAEGKEREETQLGVSFDDYIAEDDDRLMELFQAAPRR